MESPSRKNIRLKSWDYSTHACYHVTICTANRQTWLSTIAQETHEVTPTDIGVCVIEAIAKSCERYPMVVVENYVIMPNHVHLLMAVDESEVTLGRFIGFMKSYATRLVRMAYPGMDLWQRNYYDHIIRDDENFFITWQYIDENPAKWATDDYYVM